MNKYVFKISRKQAPILFPRLFVLAFIFIQTGCSYPDFPSYSKTPHKEYLNLFPENVRDELECRGTYYFPAKAPVSDFRYKKNYFLEVFRLDSNFNGSVKNIVQVGNSSFLKIKGVQYSFFEIGSSPTIYYKSGAHRANKLFLNLYGDSVRKVVTNDTLAFITANFKIFSVNYSPSDTTAIWALSNGRYPEIPTGKLPINVMFLKRNKSLYLITMTVNSVNIKLTEETLLKLLYPKLNASHVLAIVN